MVWFAFSNKSGIPSLSESKSKASSIPSPSVSLEKQVNWILPLNVVGFANPFDLNSIENWFTWFATNW